MRNYLTLLEIQKTWSRDEEQKTSGRWQDCEVDGAEDEAAGMMPKYLGTIFFNR